jgi:hypothetical protein
VTVTAAAAKTLKITAPKSSTVGTAFTITVTALDPYGNTATGYGGTIHFTSTDGSATLPADYRFTSSDKGKHTFTNGVTLRTAGSKTITATDTVTSSITGKATVTVNAPAPAPAPPGGSGQGDRAGDDAAVAAALLSSPATLPADSPFLIPDMATHALTSFLPPTGIPAILETETARRTRRMATATVQAGGGIAHVGQPFDPEGDLLDPAAIVANFAQDGFAGNRG